MNIPLHSNRQRGATLIISMVLLAIMALLTITSLRTTIQEERMSSAAYDRDLAFQAAEAGLRLGEQKAEEWAKTNPPSPPQTPGDCTATPKADGLYVFDPDCAPLWEKGVGASGAFWYKASAELPKSGLSLSPYYIVEYISGDAPCTAGAEKGGCKRFRITASSETVDGRAAVVLQSIYATDGAP
ncbi:MAG: pilus assembly protein [Azoarcus sp.]|jgi:type IV pilus assembly protein PilX|nr:pilus assembly protein [Azoarcus sp.]